MIPTLARRTAASAAAGATRPPLTIYTNPYRTKKVWPPDYKQLSWQEQLRFEKKYKRRVTIACARPGWDKGVKLVQLVTTVAVLGYMVFFAELEFFGQSYKPRQELGDGVATLFGIFSEENRYDRNPDSLPASSDKTPPSPRSR